ncbi:MAG: hypothetical protein V4819_08860 [Verrucomicrobiota bacterium]
MPALLPVSFDRADALPRGVKQTPVTLRLVVFPEVIVTGPVDAGIALL